MNNIDNVINESKKTVNSVSDLLKEIAKGADEDYKKIYGRLVSKADMVSENLDRCSGAIKIRTNSFDVISIIKRQIVGNENKELSSGVDYYNLIIPMSEARVLATTSYLSSTWSLYDLIQRTSCSLIFNYIGVESDDSKVAKSLNTSKYLSNSPFADFSFYYEFRRYYESMLKFSYEMRNAFIHESGFIEGKKILMNGKWCDAFTIDESVVNTINKRIKCKNGLSVSATDLIIQLKKANDKIDLYFCSLLKFSIDFYISELKNFVDDKKLFVKLLSMPN